MKYKCLILLFALTLVSLSVIALQISDFAGNSIPSNITFSGNANHSYNLSIYKNANVTSAVMNLSGYKSLTKTCTGSCNEGVYYNIGNNPTSAGILFNLTGVEIETFGTWLAYGTATPGNVSIVFRNTNNDSIIYEKNLGLVTDVVTDMVGYNEYNISDSPLITEPVYILIERTNTSDFIRFYVGSSDPTATELEYITAIINGSSGYEIDPASSYDDPPLNITLKKSIQNTSIQLNNTQIWNHAGEFNSTYSPNKTSDFSSILNTALNGGNCDCDGCSVSGKYCNISTLFHSDTAGILEVNNLDIDWEEHINPNLTINTPADGSGGYATTQIDINITAEDDWEVDECWFNITRGASTEVSHSEIADCSQETVYVSSRDTTYVLHVIINDTSGNTNYSNSTFTVPASATLVSGGGGGGSSPTEDEDEVYVSVCLPYKKEFFIKWEDSKDMNIIERIQYVWNSWWDYILCDAGAGSIFPI